jgi:hypothetical protein
LFRTPSFLFDSVLKTEYIQKISDDYRLKEKVKFATIDLNLQSKFIDNIIINSNINLVGNRFSKKVKLLNQKKDFLEINSNISRSEIENFIRNVFLDGYFIVNKIRDVLFFPANYAIESKDLNNNYIFRE